jgi:hypothetical protein
MVALVSVETVLLVLLAVLVAGLLRSHAEILRRLGPGGDRAGAADLPPPAARERRDAHAPPIAGATPAGDALALDFSRAGPTLLAFLSSGCSTCAGFWESLEEQQLAARAVIVTRGPERERPARLRELAGATPVVMSSQAWEDYGVPGSPYFVLVDGAVQGEGSATTWPALASLVRDAIDDERASRHQRIDDTLAAAGIGPDHPSLRPGRE